MVWAPDPGAIGVCCAKPGEGDRVVAVWPIAARGRVQ
jgi:hypothetical protein